MNSKIHYFDYNATTPTDPRVVEAMLPFFTDRFANISSIYRFAQETRSVVDNSRTQLAKLLNARADEIVILSGGTEADNYAIKGTYFSKKDKGNHIITSSVEHHAVLNSCSFLKNIGAEVTYIPVDKYGLVDPDDLKKAIKKGTILVSIMLANNEIGTIEPIKELARIAHENGVLFHTDAVQGVGKIKIDVQDLGVDMLSLSGHKFYGPKGVGALFIKKGTKITPILHGGQHEKSRRAGTENVPGIVGIGKAAEIAMLEMSDEEKLIRELRDKLEKGLNETIPEIIINGHPEKRLYNTTNVCIKYIEGEGILVNLDFEDICASSGSACTSGSLEPSHVLLACGMPHEVAHGSLRISFGKYNTQEDVDKLLEVLPPIVNKLRKMSPFWQEKNNGR